METSYHPPTFRALLGQGEDQVVRSLAELCDVVDHFPIPSVVRVGSAQLPAHLVLEPQGADSAERVQLKLY